MEDRISKLAPSILSADFCRLGEQINERKLGDFEPLFKIGWNACIDAITKEVK